MRKYFLRENFYKLFFILLGSFMYAFGMNFFVVPLGLYSGGVLGLAQIIRTVIGMFVLLPVNIDIAGIISFLLNLPLIVFAYFKIGKSFIKKTLFCISFQSFLLSVIPQFVIIKDSLTSAIIGGILCGIGIGLLLKNGGSSGGVDIIGVYITKRSTFTVGSINLIIDAFVFICVLIIIRDIAGVIYTFIFAVVTMVAIDKVHIQNINCEAIIITKKTDGIIEKLIMDELQRGVSYWYGYGAYTGEKAKVIYVVLSKYEVSALKRMIHANDPMAFVSIKSGISINGYFEKRL